MKNNKKVMILSWLLALVSCIAIVVPTILIVSANDKGGYNIPDGKHHSNLIFSSATVPINIAALSTWNSLDETYIWYGRQGTFADKNAVAKRFTMVGDAGKKHMEGHPKSEVNKMAKLVRDIYRKNNGNTFTLYCTDYAIFLPMVLFFKNGVPEENFEVILCEDGTGTANAFSGFIGNSVEGDKGEILENKIAEVDAIIEDAKNGNYNYPGFYEGWQQSIAYATKPNVKFYVTTAGRYSSVSDATTLARINKEVHTLQQLADDLIIEAGNYGKNSFRRAMFGQTLEGMFTSTTGKKPLIFTGTSYTGENGASQHYSLEENEKTNFDAAFNKVIEEFGDEYFFIYKGHPSWPQHEGYENSGSWKGSNLFEEFDSRVTYIENNFAFEIPAQLPVDMIMIFFSEYTLAFGGYDGSSYTPITTANTDNDSAVGHYVKFLFGDPSQGQTIAWYNGIATKENKPAIIKVNSQGRPEVY